MTGKIYLWKNDWAIDKIYKYKRCKRWKSCHSVNENSIYWKYWFFYKDREYSYKVGMKCRSVEIKGPYQCRIVVYHLEKFKRNFTLMF